MTQEDLQGLWGGYGVLQGVKTWVGVSLDPNGRFEVLLQGMQDDGTSTREIIRGAWDLRDGKVVLTNLEGKSFEYPFEYTANQLSVCILGGDQVVALDRIRE